MSDEKKPDSSNMAIVGLNLALFITYTIICIAVMRAVDFFLFFMGVHVVGCVLLSLIKRRWVWFLSGLLVLIIGFGTCVGQL